MRYLHLLLIALLISLLLSACNGASQPLLADPTDAVLTATATHPPALPTPTATPLPEKVLLVAGPVEAGRLETALAELASGAGLLLDVSATLPEAALGPEVRIVVLAQNLPGLQEFITAAPSTQFVLIGEAEVQPAANLSIIGPDGKRPDLQGFLAGYLAAVATQDWRVGALRISDVSASRAGVHGFLAGARYFCGLCNPPFPPYGYPRRVELPPGNSAEWQAAINALESSDIDVRTLYLAPGSMDDTLLSQLGQTRLFVIGPYRPADFPRERWLATVYVDPVPALQAMWPALLAGTGGLVEPFVVRFADVNESLLTPGRQLLVEALAADLNAGFIDTGVDLATGEPRQAP